MSVPDHVDTLVEAFTPDTLRCLAPCRMGTLRHHWTPQIRNCDIQSLAFRRSPAFETSARTPLPVHIPFGAKSMFRRIRSPENPEAKRIRLTHLANRYNGSEPSGSVSRCRHGVERHPVVLRCHRVPPRGVGCRSASGSWSVVSFGGAERAVGNGPDRGTRDIFAYRSRFSDQCCADRTFTYQIQDI